MLDATRLRVLVAVARYGSVTAAAHALNYAQPSISHHLARLEAETGARLIERAGRGVRLTEAGQLLAARAEEILGRLDAAEAELASYVGLRQDRVRIAAFGSAISAIVADAVVRVRAADPNQDIGIVQADPPKAVHLLKAGEAEIALTYRYLRDGAEPDSVTDSVLPDGVSTTDDDQPSGSVIAVEPVCLVTPEPEHRAETADRAELLCARRKLGWIATGERGGDLLAALCRQAGFLPHIVAETSDFAAALTLVAAGLGAAIMPRLALPPGGHPGTTVTALPGVTRELAVITYPAAGGSPAIARLAGALRPAFPLGEAEPVA